MTSKGPSKPKEFYNSFYDSIVITGSKETSRLYRVPTIKVHQSHKVSRLEACSSLCIPVILWQKLHERKVKKYKPALCLHVVPRQTP